MERHSLVFAEAVGRLVLDAGGRRFGRVVAVVHRHDSADVLVRRGRLRPRVVRLGVDELALTDDGYLIAERIHLRGHLLPFRKPSAAGRSENS